MVTKSSKECILVADCTNAVSNIYVGNGQERNTILLVIKLCSILEGLSVSGLMLRM